MNRQLITYKSVLPVQTNPATSVFNIIHRVESCKLFRNIATKWEPIPCTRTELSKDKYDRYLADIFVGSKEVFLNQKLLDERLAVAY